ncbi:large ribosomal subunit protein P2-like isoform X1 [Cebidichthys violaceus]|uniref:large ribosomal subunit protein P2-like isoform X1 n=1 Tax=Cebidichthys violaceus TaxID=271503 RepID=UPI0035CB64FA
MRYIAAYLLSVQSGNSNPEPKDIKKILESVGIEANDIRLEKVQSILHSTASDVVSAVLVPVTSHCLCDIHTFDISQQVITELQGKNVEEVIAAGYGKLASVPAGGAVAVASSAAVVSGGAAAAAPAAEEKKEEKEESEGSDDDMGFGLFD